MYKAVAIDLVYIMFSNHHFMYRQTFNIRSTLVGNKIVDH